MNKLLLAPVLAGAALLGSAAMAQNMGVPQPSATLYEGQPALAPVPMAPVAPMAMPAAPMAQMPTAMDRASWDALREQERRQWERERAELIRQGHGVPSNRRQ
ncbi:hypothetical protein ACI6QG_08005 [Roseococcus sp. DSY-14]|uniref:hypothetical protein n=1 Tax=Roseococcus sp. DSY-14 TaxID=3369650 RepID=UPI00387B290E